MKNDTATTLLLKALDMELKAMLQSDLENFKPKKSQVNIKQAA